MARLATALAVSLLLVAAASAITIKSSKPNSKHLLNDLVVPTHGPEPTHHGGDPDAPRKIYELTQRFIDAVMWRDFKGLDMILDPNLYAMITDLGCGFFGKADFINLIENDFMASEVVTVQGWIESGNMGVFSADVFGIRNTTSTPPNTTIHAPHVYFSIVPTADFMRIAVFQQFRDRSAVQSNATAMVNVFTKLVNASMNKDITTWTNALTSDFNFNMWFPWSPEEPVPANKTETLKMMSMGWAGRSKEVIVPVYAFAACNLVLVEFDFAEMRNDGKAFTNHFYYSMALTPDMQVAEINEFPTKPFF